MSAQTTGDTGSRPTVAVIGSGVSGLTAAYILRDRYDVTLFEADDRFGGHAHTHDLEARGGAGTRVDSGFIVHNDRTYPNLIRLFGELGVRTQDSDMSMSVRCQECGLEYAGAKGARGLFPTAGNLARPSYLRMLTEVTRFHRHARRVLERTRAEADTGHPTLGEFLAEGGYSQYFVDHFMMPLVSAVWSSGPGTSAEYPARYLFEFLDNHAMLSIGGSPTWRTVTGGSGRYVEKIIERLPAARVGIPVTAVRRAADHVEIRDQADQVHRADRVVIATHADQALAMLPEATPAQREVLGAFTYSRNEVLLHSDSGLLPRLAGARASWNYLKRSCSDGGTKPLVSYHMNRLMRLEEPVDYVVTLNGGDEIDRSAVLREMVYHHPIYTPEAVRAQRGLADLNDGVVAFAGAYHGWGFHEDGCLSGVRAAASLGVEW